MKHEQYIEVACQWEDRLGTSLPTGSPCPLGLGEEKFLARAALFMVRALRWGFSDGFRFGAQGKTISSQKKCSYKTLVQWIQLPLGFVLDSGGSIWRSRNCKDDIHSPRRSSPNPTAAHAVRCVLTSTNHIQYHPSSTVQFVEMTKTWEEYKSPNAWLIVVSSRSQWIARNMSICNWGFNAEVIRDLHEVVARAMKRDGLWVAIEAHTFKLWPLLFVGRWSWPQSRHL